MGDDSVIERILERLAEGYDPVKVILFGSRARGGGDEGSDIDLFIVKETSRGWFDRIVEVREILSGRHRRVGLDVIVLTPAELEERLALGDPFYKQIQSEGKVLYVAG